MVDSLPLITLDDISDYKSKDYVRIKCPGCQKVMKRKIAKIKESLKVRPAIMCLSCAAKKASKNRKVVKQPVIELKIADYDDLTIKLLEGYKWGDKIEVKCECGHEEWRTIGTLRKAMKKHGGYKCNTCFSKGMWDEEKRKEASEEMKKHWGGGTYNDLSETMKQKFEDDSTYQLRVSESLKKRYEEDLEYKERVVAAWKAATDNDEYREKMRNYAIKQWEENREEYLKIFNDDEHRRKLSEISKSRWEQDEKYREKHAIGIASQLGRISSIQKQLYQYLDDLNVDYEPESDKTRIGYYVFDCLVRTPEGRKDILIECQGDYWHSLKNAVRNDKAKFTYVDRYFPEYEIMYVWAHEFYTKEGVLDRLKLKLGVDIQVIDFDFKNVEIKECPASDYKSFLDAYHYIGKGRGGKCYGAYLKDDLIACCVFSPPLRQNMEQLYGKFRELSRFCIHPSYHKKNFASWFISRCLKLIDHKIISYCDTTVGHDGAMYKASNFEFSHRVSADYWYVNEDGYVMHKRTLYGKAKKLKMMESEFAAEKGYVRKYGGEKLCFIYEKK